VILEIHAQGHMPLSGSDIFIFASITANANIAVCAEFNQIEPNVTEDTPMKTITYGLMETDTQEFIGQDTHGVHFSMHEQNRFETENVSEIVNFMNSKADRYGRHYDNDGYNPSEFTPVAFIRESGAFNESLEIKELELPKLNTVKVQTTRQFRTMPEILRKRYIPSDLLETLGDKYVDFILVRLEDGQSVVPKDYVYGTRYNSVLGEVLMSVPVPEDWPIAVSSPELLPDRLLLVHTDQKALAAACTFKDIEPKASGPKI
jgi:hypothetical protein